MYRDLVSDDFSSLAIAVPSELHLVEKLYFWKETK